MRLPNLSTLTQGLRKTLARFPIPVLSAIMVTACLILAVEFDDAPEPILRIALLTSLFFVISLLIDLASEARNWQRNRRLLASAITLGAVIIYGILVVPPVLDDALPVFWYSHCILLFALHLGIALTPTGASKDPKVLWRLNLNLFLRYCFSSVNAALLYAGLALAMVSIDKLFGLNIDEEIYIQLWFACAFAMHPLLFLGEIPQIHELKELSHFPKPLSFTLRFIALPLVALYLLILYAYVGKIAILWNWPDGWVAMPIFILAVVSLLAFVLSLPLSNTETWARLYHKWLFRALMPLSVVLFLALQIRLADYGMTINRYLGLALAVWLFAISLAHILRPRLHVGWIPSSLLVISLFSIYAGPAGAFGWSQRSQTERITALAQQLGAYQDGQLNTANDSSDVKSAEQIRSSLRYIFEHFGHAPLTSELQGFYQSTHSKGFEASRPYAQTRAVISFLGLEGIQSNTHLYYNYKGVIPTFGHSWVLRDVYLPQNRSRDNRRTHGPFEFQIKQDGLIQVFKDGALLAAIDSSTWTTSVADAIKANGKNPKDPIAWHFEGNGWRFTLALHNASVNPVKKRLNSINLVLLYTSPDEQSH